MQFGDVDVQDLPMIANVIAQEVEDLITEIDTAIEKVTGAQREISFAKASIIKEKTALDERMLPPDQEIMAGLQIEYALSQKEQAMVALRDGMAELGIARVKLHKAFAKMDEFDEMAVDLKVKYLESLND